MTDRARVLQAHGHPPDAGFVSGAVGGRLIAPHLIPAGARRALLERDAADPRYALFVTRRHTMYGRLVTPGCVLLIPQLREASELVRLGHARPADHRTAVDLELDRLMQEPGSGPQTSRGQAAQHAEGARDESRSPIN